MKQISVGKDVVWALDTTGRLSVRRDIQANVFPEGSHWQTLPAMPNDPIHIGKNKLYTFVYFYSMADGGGGRGIFTYNKYMLILDISVINSKQGFRHISVAKEEGQVWAISGAGIICRRIGVTNENPAGTGWATGIGVSRLEKVLFYNLAGIFIYVFLNIMTIKY